MPDSIAPLSGLFQLAYVTDDLPAAQAMFEREYNLSGFVDIPAQDLELRVPVGGIASLEVAVAWSGNWMIELIQPVSGTVGIYQNALSGGKNFAFHHMAAAIPGTLADWEAFRGTLDDNRIALEGGRELMRFVYVDDRDTLGHYVEYVWMSDVFVDANPVWRPAMAPRGI